MNIHLEYFQSNNLYSCRFVRHAKHGAKSGRRWDAIASILFETALASNSIEMALTLNLLIQFSQDSTKIGLCLLMGGGETQSITQQSMGKTGSGMSSVPVG